MRKMTKISVTVGIPAYNEEGNIGNLISSIRAQRKTCYRLNEIVVYSDGSDDKTVEIVKRMQKKVKHLRLVEKRRRRGKLFRLNQMFNDINDDVLVILDADIGLVGSRFFERLVEVIRRDPRAMMVVAHQILLRPRNLIGRVIYGSYFIWDQIRLSVPKCDHVQNFYGAATAYQGSFARTLKIPEGVREERMYLYLMAKQINGFRYCRRAKIVYWPATTMSDFMKLARRGFGMREERLDELFGFPTSDYYKIPWGYKVRGMLKAIYLEPIFFFPGLLLNLYISKLRPKRKIFNQATWEITKSSKRPIVR